MDHGVVTFLTDYGIETLDARARGGGARVRRAVPHRAHPHPDQPESPWPGGGELPRRYAHIFDPFVALAAMAAVTDRVALGTAVSLVAQHDPIVLAKAVASVDRIAGGRFELGIGPGWNREEMANHGVDPRRRTARMLEHVAAMKEIWTHDEAEFHGEFVDFGPLWSWPKPVRTPPVLVGGGGPTVLDRVLEIGDGWIPLRIRLSELDAFASRVSELQRRAADAGRGHLPVTVYGAAPKQEAMASYAEAGVDRVLFELTDHAADGDRGVAATLRELDRLATLTS